MSNNPAIWRRNALIGSVMVFLALGLMFSSPFQVEAARPSSPTNLVGRVTSNSVTLFWDAPDGRRRVPRITIYSGATTRRTPTEPSRS